MVLGLIYFIAEEFVTEEAPVAAPQLKTRPDQVKSDETAVPAAEDLTTEEPTTEPRSDVDTEPNDFASSENTETETPISDSPTLDASSDTSQEDPISDNGQGPEQTNDFSTPAEDSFSEPDTSSDGFAAGESEGNADPFGNLSSPIEDTQGDLTEKILQDLESQTKATQDETPVEYVSPPDYEYPGRGLVYNCKAGHWACVDGPSYKTCELNASYLKLKQADPECYPFNIYETARGCTNMQNRVVSSGASTDFCKGF